MNQNNQVVLIRLSSGEEILARYDETDFNTEDQILMVRTGEGKLGFMEWMPYANTNKPIQLNPEHVVFVAEPSEALLTEYNKFFAKVNSNLILPDENKLVV